MSKGQRLRALVNERLTAAAEDIFALFERTIAEYEEELCRSKEENERKQQLLDSVLSPRVLVHRADVQVQTESLDENRLSIKLEEEQSQEFTFVIVKSEHDEQSDKEENSEPPASSSPQRMETEADGDDYNQVQIKDCMTNNDLSGSDVADKTTIHECPVCARKLGRRQDLRRHMLVHTGEKPFSCPVCGKKFRQKSNLKTHVVIHSDAVEEFLLQHQTQTDESKEETKNCGEAEPGVSESENDEDPEPQASSPTQEIEIKIEEDDVHKKNLDEATSAQNSNFQIALERQNEAGSSFQVYTAAAQHEENLRSVAIKQEEQLQECTAVSVKREALSLPQQGQTEHRQETDIDYEDWTQNWEPLAGSSTQPTETDDDDAEDYNQVQTSSAENASPFTQPMFAANKASMKRVNPKKVGSDVGGKTKHECSVCKKKLGRKQELKRHMLLHTGEKPFSCPVCEKRFIQKSNLKSHIVTHLDSVDTFLRHQRPSEKNREETEGEDCGGAEADASSDPQDNFVDSFSDTDNDEDWTQITEPTAGSSTQQMETECGGDDDSQVQTKDRSTAAQNSSSFFKAFQETCEGQSSMERISALLNHAINESKERGKTAEYQCPICTKIFGRMENLRRHLLIHTGEKAFSCPVCNKRFTLKQHLKLHMVVHTGDKQFNCSVCTKTFNRKDNLRSHMKIHSIDRPFGCSECGARFNLNKNLMRHMAVHTGETPFICTVCKSGFSSQLCLKRHAKIHKKDAQKSN